MYCLCDCNNFYASCERVFNPSLIGQAVIVLSNNDGCVIARSNEAKALGIKMGQPLYQVKELIEKRKVAVFSANFALYGDLSRRVMETLREFAPALEIYSIDEAFMDLRGIDVNSLSEFGLRVSKTVKKHTGIPLSVGIAPTKTLAKIASKLCKQYPKLNGACVMHRKEDIDKVLKKFPIEDVWGIGRRYSKMLNSIGVQSAWDFTQLSPELVRKKMSVVGLRTWRELQGTPCIEIETVLPDKQQICTSRSFAKEITDLEELKTAISNFTVTCSEKLRKQKCVCGELNVFIYTNRFRSDMPQHYENKIVRLEVPTDSSLELVKYAINALSQIFHEGYGYKKAGVILSRISPKSGQQTQLFDTVDRDKHNRIMEVVDTVNKHQGRRSILLACQGFEGVKMNRNHLSPNYTTDWADILKVKV